MTAHSSPITLRKLLCLLALPLLLLLLIGCGNEVELQYKPVTSGSAPVPSAPVQSLSETARAGENLFNSNCLQCHGANATGTIQGPPLVHKFYEPGHHSDASIRSAVLNGVPQHHWSFGNMPPVAGVSVDEVEKIICYLRETQRANGIFEGDAFPTVC